MDYEDLFDIWENIPFFDVPEEPFYEKIEQYLSPDRASHCFFTGHRKIPDPDKTNVLVRMRSSISYLYSKGVKTFHAGGARGFDTLAAAEIIDLRRYHPDMRLALNLPFPNQTDHWDERSARFYQFFLQRADEVHYACEKNVSDRETARKFLLMRNRTMVNSALYGITYFSGARGGTSYTLSYAEKSGCEIINLYNA